MGVTKKTEVQEECCDMGAIGKIIGDLMVALQLAEKPAVVVPKKKNSIFW